MRSFLLSRAAGFALVVLLVIAWQEAATHRVIDPVFVPSATDTFHAWQSAMSDGTLRDALGATLLRFLVGFALACGIGIPVGLLLGYSRVFYSLFEPSVELLRPLPPPAIIPIFILLLGIENRMKLTIIVFAAVFPVIVSTMQGVRGVDRTLIDTARTYGYSQVALMRRVILPAAMPSIFAGMRISLAIALIVTIFAEMLAGTDGVGYFVLNAERGFQIPQMYAGVVTLAVLGYISNLLFVRVERLALHWYVRQEQA
jgi:ABC-type nitrate/sulfonate/bicarbonate transport system permease component